MNFRVFEKIWKFEYHNQLAIKFMICVLLSMILFYALIVFSVEYYCQFGLIDLSVKTKEEKKQYSF